MEICSLKTFVMEHLQCNMNPADEPSRRPDNEIGYQNKLAMLLATLAVTTDTESYSDILPAITARVPNGSQLAVSFWVWVGTELEPLEQVVPHQKTQLHRIHGLLAGCTFSPSQNIGGKVQRL